MRRRLRWLLQISVSLTVLQCSSGVSSNGGGNVMMEEEGGAMKKTQQQVLVAARGIKEDGGCYSDQCSHSVCRHEHERCCHGGDGSVTHRRRWWRMWRVDGAAAFVFDNVESQWRCS